MQEFFLKIKDNKLLNSIRSGFDSLGLFNIGIATIVLIYTIVNQFYTTPEAVNRIMQYGYLMVVATIGVVVIKNVIETNDKTENRNMQFMSLFLSILWVYPLLNSKTVLTYFPLVALLASMINSTIANVISTPKFQAKNVPPAVTDYLSNVFPIVLQIVLSLIPFAIYYFMFEFFIVTLIYFLSVLSHSLTLIIIVSLICYFWYKGMHGVGVISTLFRPFWFQMMIVNTYCLITKQAIPYIVTESFLQWAVWLGGSGATLGLTLVMRLFARSKEMKYLGKDAMPSAFANINENIIFGVPIVENKIMRIPFFLAPITMGLVTYSLIFNGMLPNFALVSPWVLPTPLGAFLSTGGSLKMAGFNIVLILLSMLIYLPFFLVYDRQLLKEEKVNNHE